MIQPNSYFLLCIGTILRKLHAKKEKKLSDSFWEIKFLIEKLTTDDGRRRTTDESALEKLRCLSAGGAKKRKSYWSVSEIGPSPPPPPPLKLTPPTTTDESAFEKLRCQEAQRS